MDEVPLTGGRVTPGVVRAGATVRRPPAANARLVRALLALLDERGYDGAPRHLGTDAQGREVLTFIPGEVPSELDAGHDDSTLAAAARLIRRFHDATAGSALAGEADIVCHNDLSPCNAVFRDGAPVAIIDFDAAAPGVRLADVGMALFLWLNLGTDALPPAGQARRIGVFCRAYGVEPRRPVIDATIAAVAANVDRLTTVGRAADAVWWRTQLAWVECHRDELAPD